MTDLIKIYIEMPSGEKMDMDLTRQEAVDLRNHLTDQLNAIGYEVTNRVNFFTPTKEQLEIARLRNLLENS